MYSKMLLAGALVFACATAAAAEDVTPGTVELQSNPVGRTIADFELPDHLGTAHKLSEWADRKAIVVAFLGVECPLAKLYGPRLEELSAKYAKEGVAFVAINSNQQDSLPEIAHYVREHKLEFPVLKDPGNKIADQFGATRTPEVFLLDAERRVRYWGRIDDQYGVGYVRNAATSHDLKTALDELLAGKEITHPARESVGCFIGKVRRTEPQGTITYTEHVASIVHKHCVRCHRPGEVAPFSLTSYEDVQSWAETIDEVVDAGRMPPWHADPKHGQFWNDARLPDEAKETLRAWIRNGCPQGDLAKLPKLPEFTAGWQIPQPDVVYKMPAPFAVPAKGVVEYQHFSIDPGFKEDMWVKAAEARPGNRAVTHHLIAFFHPPGSEEWEPLAPLSNSIAGFAPGMPPAIYPEGAYRRIPAGSKIVIQAHYTPNGTAQTDLSEVGLVFAKPAEVKREFSVAAVLNFRFLIPPGAANQLAEYVCPGDTEEDAAGDRNPLPGDFRQFGRQPGEPQSADARDVGRPDLAGDDGRDAGRGSLASGFLGGNARRQASRGGKVRRYVPVPLTRRREESEPRWHVQRLECRPAADEGSRRRGPIRDDASAAGGRARVQVRRRWRPVVLRSGKPDADRVLSQ
ncbi:MAG: redoxin domain-containing protein [Pirellulaceae bacterium]|nr:redoxin domain-containing protein [Pirellulaceae bacterium]